MTFAPTQKMISGCVRLKIRYIQNSYMRHRDTHCICIYLGKQNHSLLRHWVCFDDKSAAFLQVILQTVGHSGIDANVSILCHNPAHCGAHGCIFRDGKGVQVWRKKKKRMFWKSFMLTPLAWEVERWNRISKGIQNLDDTKSGTFASRNDNSRLEENNKYKSFFTEWSPRELDSKLLIASQESLLVCKVIRRENIVLEGQFVWVTDKLWQRHIIPA